MLHRKTLGALSVASVLAVAPFVWAQQGGKERQDQPGPCYGCATTLDQHPQELIKQFGITGYADPWEVEPGDTVDIHVSTESARYHADFVRLFHGDSNPQGPGIKEEVLASGDHPGEHHDLPLGSYAEVASAPELELGKSFTITAWIAPTTVPGSNHNPVAAEWTPAKRPRPQGIVSKWSGKSGYGLFIDDNGQLALRLGDGNRSAEVTTGTGLRPWVPALPGGRAYIAPDKPDARRASPEMTNSTWYFVAASYQARPGRDRVVLYQSPQNGVEDATRKAVQTRISLGAVAANESPLLMAAGWQDSDGTVKGRYNGKIDSPSIYDRALSLGQLKRLERGRGPAATVGAWDFSKDIRSDVIRDASPNALDGRAVNLPERAVTGHTWDGALDYQDAPDQYGGIYFHEDDLGDARWPKSVSFKVPDDAESGVYAAKLRAGDRVYYAPFFVRPKGGVPTSDIALVIPTFSYLAYGTTGPGPVEGSAPAGGMSLYSRHSDGSGYQYSSRLRPLTRFQPADGVRPWQFIADTHITDWLRAKGIKVDVITDEDVDREGADLLKRYKVVMTGSHPEYTSGRELDAVQDYTHNGGRFVYMGGNGFYWVTGMHPSGKYVEVRRRDGTQAYQISPGESVLTTTGEEGGLWKFRGRPPQKYVGVGFTTQGFDRSRPYQRMPDSFDPSAAFIFDGIGRDEEIGNFPSLQLPGGAAGEELDRVDFGLGSPPSTLVLARATGFSDAYQHVIEEVNSMNGSQGGTKNPLVYADMAYAKFRGGGAVFSTSSISWAGSLYYNDYDNNVSRITENVLRRFANPEPLP